MSAQSRSSLARQVDVESCHKKEAMNNVQTNFDNIAGDCNGGSRIARNRSGCGRRDDGWDGLDDLSDVTDRLDRRGARRCAAYLARNHADWAGKQMKLRA